MRAWDLVARSRSADDDHGLGLPRDGQLILPGPPPSPAGRRRSRSRSRSRSSLPPVWPWPPPPPGWRRCARRPPIAEQGALAHPISEQGPAVEGTAGIDGHHGDRLARARRALASAATSVLFPDPGGPVIPTTCPAPILPCSRAARARARGLRAPQASADGQGPAITLPGPPSKRRSASLPVAPSGAGAGPAATPAGPSEVLTPRPLEVNHAARATRTPCAAAGMEKGHQPPVPPPGRGADRLEPLPTRRAISAAMSSTAKQTWCSPSPRRARKRPTAPSSDSGCSSSSLALPYLARRRSRQKADPHRLPGDALQRAGGPAGEAGEGGGGVPPRGRRCRRGQGRGSRGFLSWGAAPPGSPSRRE